MPTSALKLLRHVPRQSTGLPALYALASALKLLRHVPRKAPGLPALYALASALASSQESAVRANVGIGPYGGTSHAFGRLGIVPYGEIDS